jgi:putative hydrolase of the HAD superfamily
MIDAVLFDLGDTIIDWGVGRREAEIFFRQGAKLSYEHLRARHIANLPPYHRYFNIHYSMMRRKYIWSKLSGRDFSYLTVITRAAHKLGMTLSTTDVQQLASIWYQPINLASTIDPGVDGMLRLLRDAGTKLGIVSNTLVPPHCLDDHLAAEGLLHYFPVRVYSSQVRFRKPHPRIFEIALEKIGVPANRTLFIGDLLKTDIAGAKKMGMRAIWKPATTHQKELMHLKLPRLFRRHKPDVIIPKVTHLPEAMQQIGWRGTAQVSV